jgi:hypothetical protein
MYILNYEISIGNYKVKTLDSVEITKSILNLSDTAVIVLPGTFINKATDIEDKLKEGDAVVIKLGYDNNLSTEFTGYLNSISTDDTEIRLECIDGLYLLKKRLKDVELKNVGLKSLLNRLLKEVNELNAAEGIKTNFVLNCDFNIMYEKFVIFKSNGLDVLKKIQDELKANVYFENDTLHVHAPYSHVSNDKAVVFDFARNIEKSDLKYVLAKNKKIEIEVNARMPDGNNNKQTYGQSGGEKQTVVVSVSSEAAMKKIAENHYNLWYYDGYEGSFTGWLIPYVEPAYKVRLQDESLPARNGEYYVIGTKVKFGSGGGFRTVELGRRLV